MLFINPIEILDLQHSDIASIDDNTIKKAKRKLLAEIDLSDGGYFNYKGHNLSKSDCERVIDELSNNEKKEYYYQLAATLQSLNDYLATGDEIFFAHFRHESIYQLSDFINFINPTFASNFDKSLLKLFKAEDKGMLASILRTQILINSNNINSAFKSLSIELQNRILESDKIKSDIKSEESDWDDGNIDLIVDFVKENFPVDILNILPTYFQSQINKIAASINYLQLAIDENFDNSQVSLDLLSHLLLLNIESVSKPTFENNFKIVKRRNDEKLEQEKNAPILKKWTNALLQIRTAIKQVDEKALTTKAAAANAATAVNISELNSLPLFANEIRNQIGYAIRSLSISAWNAQKDINTALELINRALTINVSQDAKQKFETDLKDLQEVKKKREQQGEPISAAPDLRTTNGIGTTIYGDTLYLVFFWIPIIPLSRYNCSPTFSGYKFYGKLKLHKWQKIWQIGLPCGIALWIMIALIQSNNSPSSYSYSQSTTPTSSNIYTTPSSSSTSNNSNYSETTTPTYKEIRMKNGNITGCSDLKPSYDYSINNKLIITADMTDAAVKIINYQTNKCIRFVFINSGTTCTVKNIPEGKYYLKIAYGNIWEVKEGAPICRGHFASNALYKKDNDIYDFNKIHYDDGRVSISYYTLKLYTTYSLNNSDNSTQPNAISEDDFSNDN